MWATQVWERHLRSLISQGVTVGDVNGDGKTEVVAGTSSGYVHVLDGATGAPSVSKVKVTSTLYKKQQAFPFRTHGRIMAPILITRLHDNLPQQHLVVLSFDGFLYIIDGATGCADTVDVGARPPPSLPGVAPLAPPAPLFKAGSRQTAGAGSCTA